MKTRGRLNARSPERRFAASLHHERLDCQKDNVGRTSIAQFDGAAGASGVARQQRGVADESSRIGPLGIAGGERVLEPPHHIHQSSKTSGTSLLGSLNIIIVFLGCHGTRLLMLLEHSVLIAYSSSTPDHRFLIIGGFGTGRASFLGSLHHRHIFGSRGGYVHILGSRQLDCQNKYFVVGLFVQGEAEDWVLLFHGQQTDR